ncbi:flagellar protein FlaG [Noviherbaspirillum humi]|uniref:Flagellar protein FlaG n=1 Tax=Noviherbaspirillum humi TaxID=1688639 RepID=A0A239FYW9_9BURK|nr:flagellar protein FlaG [Noviherbaspirillum humi]SNS61945.1 flagellar protein FlaG [Noviherbaspirillum humi]
MAVSSINAGGGADLVAAASTASSRQVRLASEPPSTGGAKQASQAASSGRESEAELDAALKELNDLGRSIGQGIEFSVDQDSGRTIVKVVDSSTQEVLRQIPSKEVLEMNRSISKMQGLLVRDKA